MRIIIFLIFIFLISGFVLAADRVEINTASLEQLDKITGIGPALGQRIIDARPFSSIDDLLRVKGIGEKTLQKIKDQGLAYVVNQQLNIESPSPSIASPTPSIVSPSPALKPEKYPDNILISEILPSPDGPDDQNEWIELANLNDFEADLSGWQMQDINGKTTIFTFPNNTKIPSNGFLTITRPETKISLNNDQDGLKLIRPDKTIADFVEYQKASTGQSYSKIKNSWQWSDVSTKGMVNKASTNISGEIPNKNDNSLPIKANIKESFSKTVSKIRAWPIAFLIALCSAGIIMFLKSKIKPMDKNEFLR